EKAIAHTPGVKSAAVNLASEVATIFPGPRFDPAAVERAVAAAGYRATPRTAAPDGDRAAREAAHQARLTLLAIALAAPLLAIAMLDLRFRGSGWVQFALATAIVFLAGAQFFVVAFRKIL